VDGSQFVKSIWTVQPNSKLQDGNDTEYLAKIGSWSAYSVKYRLDNTQIHFKVELQTDGGEGWFGMVRHNHILLLIENYFSIFKKIFFFC
jgi:hypothetical protein